MFLSRLNSHFPVFDWRIVVQTADNRCHAYLQESISKDGMAPAALPVSMRDSQELQHYGVDIFSAA